MPARGRRGLTGETWFPPLLHRGAQIRTGDLSDPNGARYQAAPHPDAERLAAARRRHLPGTALARCRDIFAATLSCKTTKEENVNVVTLIGNLATDVDVRDVGNDRKVADQGHHVH